MSVYNGRPYLNGAIQSITEQSYRDFEFLIIDDASTDGSNKILEKWRRQDSRIRIISHKVNRGLGYSLREGVIEARGDWIARMDDDDISVPDRLEKQVEFVRTYPETDVVGGWAIEIDEQGRQGRMRTHPIRHEEIVRLIWTSPLQHSTVFFRRDAIRRTGSYSATLRRRQDYDLWFRCVAGGLRFANIPEPLIYYRFTDDFYRKNDIGVALDQARIGWRGCWMVGANPVAYIGVTLPLIRALLPKPLSRLLQRAINRFNPRQNT